MEVGRKNKMRRALQGCAVLQDVGTLSFLHPSLQAQMEEAPQNINSSSLGSGII